VRADFRSWDDVQVFAAPGRVNLVGDHTDYTGGLVLPMTIDRECVVTVGPGDDALVRARSAELPGTVAVACDGSTEPATVDPSWARFVAGVVRAVADRGGSLPPTDLSVTTTIPIGSGLSSSSALAVACALALTHRAGLDLDGRELARLALDAEVMATGVPGGLMDQLCSIFGQPGHALRIDCRSLEIDPVVLPRGVAVLVVHSGVPRVLAGSAYATRRSECEAAARRLGLASLRDASPDQVADDPRARHVVSENARVLATADALPRGDLSVLGPLLLESHASLRDDFEVSTPELDELVEILVDSGAAGARLTGAGFGGCVVALVQRNHADDVAARATLRYGERTGLDARAFVAQAVAGAGPRPA
jgi:galactokinase